MLSRITLLLCSFTVLILGATSASADCLVQPAQTALSGNGMFKATLSSNGLLKLWKKDAKSKRFVPTGGGNIDLRGHHFNIFVPDTGDRVVVFDLWEGVGVYRPNGATVRYHAGTALLTAAEVEAAPDKWTCHPQGALFDSASVASDGTARLKVHNGRQIVLRLRDGEVVQHTASK